jgi:hypothetical protein
VWSEVVCKCGRKMRGYEQGSKTDQHGESFLALHLSRSNIDLVRIFAIFP